METALTEKKLNDSLSKKEVTFCNESSILYYSTDSTVDSLNSSMMKNSDILKDSHKIPDCQTNLISDYCSSNLKKAMVLLEKLPEELIKKYSNLNGMRADVSCCLKNAETQNIKQAFSSNSDPFQTIKINQIPEEQRFLHDSLNVKVLISRLPDDFIKYYETCSAADTFLENTCNEVSELRKNLNLKTQATKVSRKNHKTKHSLFTNQNLDSVQFLENSLEKMPSSAELLTSECQDNTCLENTNKEVINVNRVVNCVKEKSSKISSKNQNKKHLMFTDKNTDSLKHIVSLQNSFEKVPPFAELITSECEDNMCIGNTSNEVANLNKVVSHVKKKSSKSSSKKHKKNPKKFIASNSRNNECLEIIRKLSKLNKVVNHAKASKFSRKNRKKKQSVFMDKNTDFVQHSMSPLNSSENSEYSSTNSTQKNKVIKSLDSDAFVLYNNTASQKSEVSFEEYPCVEDISYTFDQFQSRKIVSLHLEPKIVTNTTNFCNSNENALLNKTNQSKIITSSKSVLNNENTINPNLFGGLSSSNSSEAHLISNMPPNEEMDPEVLYVLEPVINIEKTNISSRNTLLNNVPEISPDVNRVLFNHKNSSEDELSVCNEDITSDVNCVLLNHKNSSEDELSMYNEDIINHTNSENSDLYEHANKRFPCILLEKINFPVLESVIKDHTYCSKENITESTNIALTSPVNDDTDTTDLPIKIKKVCSISKRRFNKTQKHNKKLTNQGSSHADNFNKCETSVIKPQFYDSSLLQTSKSNSKIFTSSEDSSSEDDRPLINTMKHKYALAHSVNYSINRQRKKPSSSENSPDGCIPPIYLVKNNADQIVVNKANKKNLHVKSQKHENKANKKSLHVKSQKHKKRASSDSSSKSPSPTLVKMCSQTSPSVLNKKKVIENNKHIQIVKNKKINKSAKASKKKKTGMKSFKKKQKRIYQLLMKYLKMQMKSMSKREKTTKSMKQKKKSRKKQKNLRDSKSEKLITPTEESYFESDSSTALVYNSKEEENQCVQTKYSFQGKVKTSQCKKMSKNESTVKKSASAKARKKIFDKYRLGFLSNESSVRTYNRFLASERLRLSNGKKKKEKKKQFKKLLKRLKEVGYE